MSSVGVAIDDLASIEAKLWTMRDGLAIAWDEGLKKI